MIIATHGPYLLAQLSKGGTERRAPHIAVVSAETYTTLAYCGSWVLIRIYEWQLR